MSSNLRNTTTLFIGVGLLFLSSGMLFTLVVVRAKDAGFSTQAIAVLQSSYQFGWLLAAIFISSLIHKVGHIRVFAALTALASSVILIQILYIQQYAWILDRIVMGICIAGLMVVAESWLNEMSINSDRGRNLAIYTIVSWGAPIIGVWLLRFGETSGNTLFLLASVLISLAAIPLLLSVSKTPQLIEVEFFGLRKLYNITPLGFIGTLIAGMCHGAFFGLIPVYGVEINLQIDQLSNLIALGLFSGVLLQWPIALISDKFDRRFVLISTASFAAFPAIYFSFIDNISITQLYISISLMGAFTISLYSQCIAHVNDLLKPAQIVSATGLLVLIYGFGFALAPLIIGQLIAISAHFFFISNGLLSSSLALYTLYRTIRTKPVEDQGELINIPVASPYSAVVIAAEEWAEDTDLEYIKESKNPV
ncbi:MAG: MFS transporter [Gammaproteobacteria bacterium]|nr:MFS transporter [Gammaproteobacteria bacterium]